MVDYSLYLKISLEELFQKFPFVKNYLDGLDLPYSEKKSFQENLSDQNDGYFEQRNSSLTEMLDEFEDYLKHIFQLFQTQKESVEKIVILPGRGKDGEAENFDTIEIKKGEMVALVGATGSGKSRFLEDIEWQADGDTPTKRRVYINGISKTNDSEEVGKQRLVAQLSQNMNFVLDMTVEEFLFMHAECFDYTEQKEALVDKVFYMANDLSGEPFKREVSITSLSGGQSRALMIADCAVLSSAPVVLIDEIENAGIDRRKAMELLVGEDKIVLIATHDPVLALLADRRIVIDNGRVLSVIQQNEKEQKMLELAEEMDRVMMEMRQRIRKGEIIVTINQ